MNDDIGEIRRRANLRLECLRMAQQILPGASGDDIRERARKYADFVLGTRDAEIVTAAHDFASKIA